MTIPVALHALNCQRTDEITASFAQTALLDRAGRHGAIALTAKPALVLPVPKNCRHGRGQVQAVPGRDYHEPMAMPQERLGHTAILRTENVERLLWVLERVQRLRVGTHLDSDG